MKFISLFLAATLVSCSGTAISQNYSIADAKSGAELRSHAEVAIPILFDPCNGPKDLAVQRARYENIKADFAQKKELVDLEIVEADYDYQMSLVDIACADPDAPETKQILSIQSKVAESGLDRLEKLLEKKNGGTK